MKIKVVNKSSPSLQSMIAASLLDLDLTGFLTGSESSSSSESRTLFLVRIAGEERRALALGGWRLSDPSSSDGGEGRLIPR